MAMAQQAGGKIPRGAALGRAVEIAEFGQQPCRALRSHRRHSIIDLDFDRPDATAFFGEIFPGGSVFVLPQIRAKDDLSRVHDITFEIAQELTAGEVADLAECILAEHHRRQGTRPYRYGYAGATQLAEGVFRLDLSRTRLL